MSRKILINDKKTLRLPWLTLFLLVSLISCKVVAVSLPTSERSIKAIARVEKKLKVELSGLGLDYGSPLFIRIFKQSAELEVWLKKGSQYQLFKIYKVCNFSGDLGPKTREGDNQAPEGFYFVKANRLNPWSRFHLSFNLGYPNAYERSKGYTGGALMVHGECVSIGCYAMTNAYIDEIYALAHSALQNGQAFFRVHAFPFRLEDGALGKYKQNKWYVFWQSLQQGYQHFERYGVPPNVTVKNGEYQFERGD